MILAGSGPIGPEHLMLDFEHEEHRHRPCCDAFEAKPSSERGQIIAALEQCGGNQTRAARLLGMSRSTLVDRVERYRLPRPKKA